MVDPILQILKVDFSSEFPSTTARLQGRSQSDSLIYIKVADFPHNEIALMLAELATIPRYSPGGI
jgi:hypothetical protein